MKKIIFTGAAALVLGIGIMGCGISDDDKMEARTWLFRAEYFGRLPAENDPQYCTALTAQLTAAAMDGVRDGGMTKKQAIGILEYAMDQTHCGIFLEK